MRQGPNGRRSRNRHHGGGQHNANSGGNSANAPLNAGNRPRSASSLRHQTFDSNCFDVRVRGNAWQVHEKYLALARDAQGSGDRISAENFFQHAEHYFRIIEAINEATAQEQRQRATTQGFSQQPDIPSGYYDNGQGASVAIRGSAAEMSNAALADGSQRQSQMLGPQQTAQYVGSGIPPALTDPFFGSEEGDESHSAEDKAIQR